MIYGLLLFSHPFAVSFLGKLHIVEIDVISMEEEEE